MNMIKPTDKFQNKFLPPNQYRNPVQPMPGTEQPPMNQGMPPNPGGMQPGPAQPPVQPVQRPGMIQRPQPGVGPQGQAQDPNQQFMQAAISQGIPPEAVAQFLAQKMGMQRGV